MASDLPPSTAATVLLGKVLVGVGIAYGAVLVALPLSGPEWPRLAMGAAVTTWGLLAWWRAAGGHADAPFILAAGLSATSWSYYLIVPELGTQVTGTALLLPILACLPILGPRGVAIVGMGSIAIDLLSCTFEGIGPDAPPVLTASLVVATALGWVVARLHEQYVRDVAQAHAAAREAALREDMVKHQADFLRRFINAASHEIATPLTPIMLSLSGGRPSAAGLDRIRRNADRLQHIAGGLGEVAEIEARPLDHLEHLSLRRTVTRAMRAHGVDWRMEGDGMAWATEGLVDMIIGELVDNQLRHAPDTEVSLRLDSGRLVVRQEPAGVEPDAKLGAPFARHHPTSRGGLGLYGIARRLERNGGSLAVQFEGEGLVHDIRFPAGPQSQPS